MNHSSEGRYRALLCEVHVIIANFFYKSVVRKNMIPMLPTLLIYISNNSLPCSAKIEVRKQNKSEFTNFYHCLQATRGCNTLLEECSVEHRCTISAKPQIKKLMYVHKINPSTILMLFSLLLYHIVRRWAI